MLTPLLLFFLTLYDFEHHTDSVSPYDVRYQSIIIE